MKAQKKTVIKFHFFCREQDMGCDFDKKISASGKTQTARCARKFIRIATLEKTIKSVFDKARSTRVLPPPARNSVCPMRTLRPSLIVVIHQVCPTHIFGDSCQESAGFSSPHECRDIEPCAQGARRTVGPEVLRSANRLFQGHVKEFVASASA